MSLKYSQNYRPIFKLKLVAWTLGIAGGIIFNLLRIFGIVRLFYYDKHKITSHAGGLLVVYRHPSLREPAYLPFLFFPQYLFNSLAIPFSTPNKFFYSKWWFTFFRPVCIVIDNSNHRTIMQTLEEIKLKLLQGHPVLIAPGGGREFKGEHFKFVSNEGIRCNSIKSTAELREIESISKGVYIRRFLSGLGWLLENTNARVLPVWVENKGLRTTIIMGDPVKLESNLPRKHKLELLEDILLGLKISSTRKS